MSTNCICFVALKIFDEVPSYPAQVNFVYPRLITGGQAYDCEECFFFLFLIFLLFSERSAKCDLHNN